MSILEILVKLANWLTIGLGLIFTFLSYFLSKKHNSQQLRSYVPTIWTSWGIFFTFLSIYVTLSGFTQNDSFEMNDIINGVIPAFSTSVIGILGAIITAYIDRWRKSSKEYSDNQSLVKFLDGRKASDKDAAQSPDIVLLELVRDLRKDIGTSHTKMDSLKVAIEKSSDVIKDALDEHKKETNTNFNTTLEAINKKFTSHIENFEEETAKKHERQIKQILDNFNTELKTINREHQGTINTLIQLAQENNASIKESMTSIKKEFTQFISEEDLRIQNSFKATSGALNTLYENIKNLFETKIKESIEAFAQQQYAKSEEIINSELTRFVRESQNTLAYQEKNNSEFLTSLGLSLKSASGGLVSDVSKMKENMMQHLDKLFDENAKDLNAILSNYISNYNEIAETIQFSLTASYDIFDKATARHAMEYKKSLAAFNQEFNNSAKEMSKTLNTHLDNLQKETQKLEKQHYAAVEGIHKNGEEQMIVVSNNISGKLSDDFSELIKEIQSLQQSITASSNDYVSKHDELKQKIATESKSLVEKFSKEIKNATQITELKNACSDLNNSISKTIGDFEHRTTSITDSLENIITALNNCSSIADDTAILTEYVNSTIKLYKEHATQTKILETNLENILMIVNESLKEVKKSASEMRVAKPSTQINKEKKNKQ